MAGSGIRVAMAGADRGDTGRWNNIAREGIAGQGVDDVQRPAGEHVTLREIPERSAAVGRLKFAESDERRRSAPCRGRRRFVLSVVHVRDPDFAAEARAPGSIGLVGDGNTGRVAEEALASQSVRRRWPYSAAMIVVRAGFHQVLNMPPPVRAISAS